MRRAEFAFAGREAVAREPALVQVSAKLGEAASAGAQAPAGDGGQKSTPEGAGGDNVVDADFEEVDDHKRSQ